MSEKNQDTEKKWHNIDGESVLKELKTSRKKGLSKEEAEKRLKKFGENKLPEKKEKNELVRFLLQFHNVLIYVLLAAAAITGIIGHWIDTSVILVVVLVNGAVGYIQERKAEKALEGIKKMLSLEAMVIRDSKKLKINADQLVPGDIVFLKAGDKIPADIRIIQTKNFRVEEAPLTGESTDVSKSPEPDDEKAIVGDQRSMAFSGTMVTYGTATGVVVKTGTHTEIGKISSMISEVKEITTPLLQKIDRFSIYLSIFILFFSVSFFVFGYFFRDYSLSELFRALIGVVVAAIPEGLPAIITIALAVGVQRMASRNAIIRRLPSVETLGSVHVICSDKTGTLTKNEMTARTVITKDDKFEVEGSGYIPEGRIKKNNKEIKLSGEKVLEIMMQCIRACNDASLDKIDNEEWELKGTPTEGALLSLSYKAGLEDFTPERKDSIPFESEHKYMATLNKVGNNNFIFLKGAAEKLLEKCSKHLSIDGEQDIDPDFWWKQLETIAGEGQRVIAAAYRKEKDSEKTALDHKDVEKDMVFLGLIGIIDPARDEVYSAVKECKEAGIRVIMITGDHAMTAQAIAKDLGIDNEEGVITGSEIEEMDDEKLSESAMKVNVFSRTTPEHKLRLLKALQGNNLFCAMTGDGVNDAPALKRANIGIAMGIKGTEVSKEASEMVLADDNFASIVNAIEEGRTVYDNIRKTILFILPTNGAEALVLIAALLWGRKFPSQRFKYPGEIR